MESLRCLKYLTRMQVTDSDSDIQLVYYDTELITAVKCFIVEAPVTTFSQTTKR